jgi:hypothetical protein
LKKEIPNDPELQRHGIDATAFFRKQGYSEETRQVLTSSLKTAMQQASIHWMTPNESSSYLNCMLSNLQTETEQIDPIVIQETLVTFFSDPNNELEDYGLLPDLVLERNSAIIEAREEKTGNDINIQLSKEEVRASEFDSYEGVT